MLKHIKVNLPNDEENYKTGNGEGVWVLVEEEIANMHDRGDRDAICCGVLENDSIYYPRLKDGTIIRFKLRGECRPVAIYEDLQKYREEGYDWRKAHGV